MQVEISTLISGLSLIIAIIVAVTNIRNKNYLNDRESASEITTLIVKLESIAEGINEIKSDMRNIKNEIQDLRDRLIIVEQSTKSAHERLDGVVGNRHNTEKKYD